MPAVGTSREPVQALLTAELLVPEARTARCLSTPGPGTVTRVRREEPLEPAVVTVNVFGGVGIGGSGGRGGIGGVGALTVTAAEVTAVEPAAFVPVAVHA